MLRLVFFSLLITVVGTCTAVERTVDFSGIADMGIGDARATMRHIANASGFFVTKDGYFVTDKHAVAGAERLIVVIENKAYEAESIELPNNSGCALLKVKGGSFTPVTFAQDDRGKAGKRLLLAGFSVSEVNGIVPQLSWGVVSDRKKADEFELFVGFLPEQSGALVMDDRGMFQGMAFGSRLKPQRVCRVIRRKAIDRVLPTDVRRKLLYTTDKTIVDFDQIASLAAKCTGVVLVYGKERRNSTLREGKKGALNTDKEELSFNDLETLTQKSKDKKTHLSGTGSGFFITRDGYFITNYHVIDGAEEVIVLRSGKTYAAEVIAKSKDSDLALLKLEGVFHPVSLAETNGCEVGQEVFLAGYPKPELQGLETKVTKGIISSRTGFMGDANLYQIDAAIQGGNSGGPAGDKFGNVIGVAVAQLRNAQLVTYIIKLNVLYEFLPKGVRSSVVKGENTGGKEFTEAVRSVVDGTGMVLSYAKGAGGLSLRTARPDERRRMMRNIRRAMLNARSAKLEDDWRAVDEITSWVLEQIPSDAEAKELHDMAMEKLGRHLVIRAVVGNRDVKAKIIPVCGFKRNYVNCEEPTELFDKNRERGFEVVARLVYEEEGKSYEGVLECVYDWPGTKELRVELKPVKSGI